MALFWICVWLWGYVLKGHRRARKNLTSAGAGLSATDPVQLKYLELLDQEIEHYRGETEKLAREEHELDNKIWWYEKKGLSCKALKDQLAKVQQKLWSAKTKFAKAELNKMKAERKLQNND